MLLPTHHSYTQVYCVIPDHLTRNTYTVLLVSIKRQDMYADGVDKRINTH